MSFTDPKYFRDRRERLRNSGICTRCAKDFTAKGSQECSPCLKRRRHSATINSVRRNARLFAHGLCVRCGKNPPEVARKQCVECLEDCRIRNAERRSPGQCAYCRKRPASGGVLCKRCRVVSNANYKNWSTLNRNIAKAAIRLVAISDYLAKESQLSGQERDELREQSSAAMRDVFSAVHALHRSSKSSRGRISRKMVAEEVAA